MYGDKHFQRRLLTHRVFQRGITKYTRYFYVCRYIRIFFLLFFFYIYMYYLCIHHTYVRADTYNVKLRVCNTRYIYRCIEQLNALRFLYEVETLKLEMKNWFRRNRNFNNLKMVSFKIYLNVKIWKNWLIRKKSFFYAIEIYVKKKKY